MNLYISQDQREQVEEKTTGGVVRIHVTLAGQPGAIAGGAGGAPPLLTARAGQLLYRYSTTAPSPR